MKFLLFICLSISFSAFAQEWEWVKRINGYQNDSSLGVDTDDSGYVYVCGRSKYAVTFEDGINSISHPGFSEQDVFVAKYDSDGNLIWANVAGSHKTAYDQGYDVVADNLGGCYVAGMTNDTSFFGNDTIFSLGASEAFITHINSNGEFEWTKTIGSTGIDRAYGVEIDVAGNVYFCGYIASTAVVEGVTIGTPGKANGFIAKLDNNGDFIAVECFNTIFQSYVYAMEFREDNTLYICGGFAGTTYFGGVPKLASSPTQTDAFLAKFDTDLNYYWLVSGGSPTHDVAYQLCSVNNSIYVAGAFTGIANFSGTIITYNAVATGTVAINNARDLFVAKYDTSGNLIWIKNYGNQGMDELRGIDVSPTTENIYVSGYFSDTVDFDGTILSSTDPTKADLLVMRMDSSGNIVWIKQTGNGLSTHAAELSIDKYENIYPVGEYYQTHIFDDFVLLTNGSRDGFAAKLLQHPEPTFSLSDSVFCPGDTVALTINALTFPVSFDWSINSDLDGWVDSNTFYFVMPDSIVELDGYVISANSKYSDTLSFTNNLTFYNHQLNTNQVVSDTILCPGVELWIHPEDALNNILWMNSFMQDTFLISSSGVYYFEGYDNNYCLIRDTVIVSYSTNESFNLADSQGMCPDSTLIVLGPIGDFLYEWSSGNVGYNYYQDTISNAGFIWLTITDSIGCVYSDTTFVDQFLLTPFSLGSDTTTCELGLWIVAPLIYESYSWSNGSFGLNLNEIFVTTTGSYSLLTTDANGCITSDTIHVSILNCLNNPEYEKLISFYFSEDGNIQFNGVGLDQIDQVIVYNLAGQEVFNYVGSISTSSLYTGYLSDGLYFVRVQLKDGFHISNLTWKQ